MKPRRQVKTKPPVTHATKRTAKPKRPMVLLVDDRPDELTGRTQALQEYVNVELRAPSEVTATDLARANVVLVDLKLDEWPERDEQSTVSLQPKDGRALAAVLRSHTDLAAADGRAPAFALHSGRLDDLAGGLPAKTREYAIARTYNVEWAFRKEQSPAEAARQMAVLGDAVTRLPPVWPDANGMRHAVMQLLSLPQNTPWAPLTWDGVADSHPPAREEAVATHGMAFIRWLLQEVLPFPTFLWDEHYLAARLRVTPTSLRHALAAKAENAELHRTLEPVRYRGILAEFLGPRWWRVGVEQTLRGLTDGRPFDAAALDRLVKERLSRHLKSAGLRQPVVAVNSQFRPTDELIERDDAVQIRPDDWPPSADAAWVNREVVADDPALSAIVVEPGRRAHSHSCA